MVFGALVKLIKGSRGKTRSSPRAAKSKAKGARGTKRSARDTKRQESGSEDEPKESSKKRSKTEESGPVSKKQKLERPSLFVAIQKPSPQKKGSINRKKRGKEGPDPRAPSPRICSAVAKKQYSEEQEKREELIRRLGRQVCCLTYTRVDHDALRIFLWFNF